MRRLFFMKDRLKSIHWAVTCVWLCPEPGIRRRIRHAQVLGKLVAGGADWRGQAWGGMTASLGVKNHGGKGRVWCCLEESIKDSGRIQYMRRVWKNELGFGVQRSENSQSKNKGMCDLLWLRQGTGSMARAEDEKSAPTSKCQTKRVLPKLRKGNLLTKF